MKKYIYLLLIGLFTSSCMNMLDTEPYSAIAPEKVTPDDLQALRMGMYNKVMNLPTRESYILFDIIGGNLMQSTGNPIDLINGVLTSLNSIVSNNWSGYYKALYQVNNVMAIVDDLPSSKERDIVKGEAHYFRALIYQNLVMRWGGVPLLRKNTMDKLPRSSEEDIWKFILDDLGDAINLLSSSSSYYYVSKDAALALKARVLLYMGQKTEAAEIAESLITKSKYSLDSFDKIFRKSANTEVIFSFECLQEESSITISTLFYTYAHPNHGSYVYKPTPEVMNMYDSNDLRKSISITEVGTDACINKYPSGQTGTDPVIISRLGEMYLISAEAQGLRGLSRLNELRKKRGLNPINPQSEKDYLEAILTERRKELLAEGFRYYDLVRTHKAQEVLGILDYQCVLPIPGRELLNNKNLEPNQGY